MTAQKSDKLLSLYNTIRKTHDETFITVKRLGEALAHSQDICECTNAVAVLKRCEEMLRDARTETERAIKAISKATCALYVRAGQIGQPIRTEWVTGTPDLKSVPRIP